MYGKLLYVVLASCFFGSTVRAAENISCPDTIRFASVNIEENAIPSGYGVLTSGRSIKLTGENMYDGPPEREASLIPRSEKSRQGEEVAVWKFEGEYPLGKFISCDYAYGLVRLTRRVDDAASSCSAVSAPRKATRFNCE